MGVAKSVLYLLFFPFLLLLPISLIMRRTRMALAILPAALAFGISYGPFFFPRTREAPTTHSCLRVATFNLETPNEEEAAKLAQIIDAIDADIVALQELSPAASDTFAAKLNEKYPYQSIHPVEAYAGQGVLSRYPIQEDEYWRYEKLPGALGHQRILLMIDQRPVVLYNVHPVPPVTYNQHLNATPHRTAIKRLIEEIENEDAQILLAGDFNMTDKFYGYHILKKGFTDAFRAVGEVGFGFTFPHKRQLPLPPFLRLDYIFYDKNFIGLRAKVWPNSGNSDHAPVVANLAWLDSPANAVTHRDHRDQ